MRARIGCLAVALLMLWLNGLGCVLCCSSQEKEHCDSEEQAASAAPSCCMQPADNWIATDTDAVSQPQGARWCNLLPNQAPSLAVSPRTGDEMTVVPAVVEPVFVPQSVPRPALSFPPPFPQSRGDTYLRCCVLLI